MSKSRLVKESNSYSYFSFPFLVSLLSLMIAIRTIFRINIRLGSLPEFQINFHPMLSLHLRTDHMIVHPCEQKELDHS